MGTRYNQEDKSYAIQLSKEMGSRRIARLLGIPRSTIRYWTNPQHRNQVQVNVKKNRWKYNGKYKERDRNYAKEYYERNRDNPIFKLKNNERSAAWRKTHKDECRQYVKENKEKFKAYKAKRRAKKRQNGGSFTEEEWSNLKIVCANSCLLCGKHESEVQLTPDHIVPISRGGDSNISNIQPLCKRCNSVKSNSETFIDTINI